MEKKKNYRVYIALDLVTEDEGKSLAMVNIRRMSNEPCPMPVMTAFMQGMSKLAPKVMITQQPSYGKDNQRVLASPADDFDCDDYEKGTPEGRCDGMGHYLCDECKWRNPESIRQKHEDWMRRMAHKKDWPKIRARVIDTDEEVLVDDHPIDFFHTTYYNMWHNTDNGMTYHDDDLEFIDERLQKIRHE